MLYVVCCLSFARMRSLVCRLQSVICFLYSNRKVAFCQPHLSFLQSFSYRIKKKKNSLMSSFAQKIIVAFVFCSSSIILAQQSPQKGSITGKVYDARTREPLSGANVTVVGTTLGAVTDGDGRFVIPRVPPGVYRVRVSVLGYTPLVKTDIVITMAKPVEIDLPLNEAQLELEQVEVTAEYFPNLPDTPLSTQLQSSEEIRRLPGGLEDVVRAISILPGVAQVEPARNDLIVRGGAPSENLFVIDNIEVPNINHYGTQGGSGGPISYVNLDFVQGTSFSTGGFGVRYGDKLSSVLMIDLREGRRDRLGGKGTISASQFGLSLEGPFEEQGTFTLSARRSYLDFIFKAAGFAFVPEYWDFLGKANYHIGKDDQINVLGIGILDVVKLFNETPEKRYDNSRILTNDQNQFVGGVSWRHLFRSGFSTITLSQTYADFHFRQNDTLIDPIFNNNSIEDEWSLGTDVVWQVRKGIEFTAGLFGKLIQFKSDVMLQPFWTNYGQQISAHVHYDTIAWKGAAYGQITNTFERLRLTFGGRVDYFDLIRNKFVASLRSSLGYAVTPTTNVHASFGQYHQAPSYIWLVANPMNRQLSYISVDQYILGVDHLFSADLKVSLEAYYKRYYDYPASLTRPFLVLANTGTGFGGSDDGFASFGLDPLISDGEGESRGFEFFLQKKLSEIPIYGTVSVSYSETRFKALDQISRPGNFDQPWIINFGGGYVFDEQWEASAKFRFATGRPYTPYNPGGTQSITRYNSERLSPNHSLDLRVDRRWMFERWTLVLFIDIQNVYDRKPLDIPRYNERTGREEQIQTIGILPSVGISAEF